MRIPVAKPEVLGKYKSISDLRTKTKDWLVKTFTNKKILNYDTFYVIEFNGRTFRRLMSESPGDVKCKSYTALSDIIQSAEFLYAKKDIKNRDEVIQVITFASKVIVDGITYPFWFKVRHMREGKKEHKYMYSGHVPVKKKTP